MSIIRVTPLLPPPLRTGVSVKPQHVHWQVGRYKEGFSVGPGGVGRRQVWVPERENEQHNLLLDHLFTSLVAAGPDGGFLLQSLRAHVGTGSIAPSSTQTGLQSPLVSTDFVPSGSGDEAIRVSPGVYDIRRVREFTETQVGNQNLTEWGFGRSTANSLMCRELFRDGSGNPIVITPASDQRLRLIYTYRITYTPVTPVPVTLNITGLGTRTGQFLLTRARSGIGGYAGFFFDNDHGDIALMESLIRGAVAAAAAVSGFAGVNALPLDYNDLTPADAGIAVQFVDITYKPNVGRSRKVDLVFAASDFNINIRSLGLALKGYGIGAGYVSTSRLTARLVLDPGNTINKNNLHRLVMNDWEVTW